MRQPLLLSMILFYTIAGIGQTNIVKGLVTEYGSDEPLIGVNIYNQDQSLGTYTDEKGRFVLKSEEPIQEIEVSYIGFKTQKVKISDAKILNIKLIRDASDLAEIVITSVKKGKPISRKKKTIRDFIVDQDHIICLSTIRPGRYYLELMDHDGFVTKMIKLDEFSLIEDLQTSCTGVHYLVTEYLVYEIHVTDGQIIIGNEAPRSDFEAIIERCIDICDSHIYYKEAKLRSQLVSIFGYDKTTGDQTVYGHISDEANLNNYETDQYYLAIAEGQGFDVGKIEDKNSLKKGREAFQRGVLLKHAFYHPADFFFKVKGEYVYVIDHEKHILRSFEKSGKLRFVKKIYYSKIPEWSGRMITDQLTDQVYTLFVEGRNATIKRVDLETGLLSNSIALSIKHLDNFDIYDGTLFYTQSGITEGDQAKVLHKVSL